MSAIAIGALFGGLWIFGFCLALVLTTVQCSKQDFIISTYEGAIWASLPVLFYTILEFFPYMKSEFASGVQYLFGWTGLATDPESWNTLGLSYALILAGLIVTTRLVHTISVQVCKPTKAELSAFTENLMKSLKEKEDAKKHDEELNKE
jgi:hypothetical protein